MCLFLMSCKTMSYKPIQTISCTCNDTILQADKKLPIPYTESFSNDSIRISISKTTEYTKHIYFLQTNQKRVIDYDLQGNIKRTRLSIPYTPIGREFFFDESGNIKEVINHDEGWNICAFQALAIAKKRAGNNYYKEDPLWQLRREMYKNKKIWKINYKNRRYKWRTLYIDKDTGKILKVERR